MNKPQLNRLAKKLGCTPAQAALAVAGRANHRAWVKAEREIAAETFAPPVLTLIRGGRV